MEKKLLGTTDLIKEYDLLPMYRELIATPLNEKDWRRYTKDIAGKIDYTPGNHLRELISNPPSRLSIRKFTQEELDSRFSFPPGDLPVTSIN
jgi:hypothetical protein